MPAHMVTAGTIGTMTTVPNKPSGSHKRTRLFFAGAVLIAALGTVGWMMMSLTVTTAGICRSWLNGRSRFWR